MVGEGWGDATLLENIDTAPADQLNAPELGVDDSGNALVLWSQNDGIQTNLWYNRYEAGVGWQSEALLENEDTNAKLVAFDMNSRGTALAAWSQENTATATGNIASRHYVPGEGWGPAETFDFIDFDTYDSDLAVDESGNALLFQAYDDGDSNDIWFNRYSATSGWASATFLASFNMVSILSRRYSPLIASISAEPIAWERLASFRILSILVQARGARRLASLGLEVFRDSLISRLPTNDRRSSGTLLRIQ